MPGRVYTDMMFGPPQNSLEFPVQGMRFWEPNPRVAQSVMGCAPFSIELPQSGIHNQSSELLLK